MGLVEVGAYLEELRRIRNLTRQEAARQVGLSVDTLQYAEKGYGRVNGAALLHLIQLLDGSFHQVLQLLDDERATAEGARALAQNWVIRPAAIGDRRLTDEEQKAELWELVLRRAGGDVDEARRLLLRALETSLPERKPRPPDDGRR